MLQAVDIVDMSNRISELNWSDSALCDFL